MGPVWTPPHETSPVDYFDRFFLPVQEEEPSLWDYLLGETNKYVEWYISKTGVLHRTAKVHKWKPLEMNQLRAFIGVTINMGLIRKHTVDQYWNTKDYTQDTPVFRKIFKQDTFKLILRFFHASDSALEPRHGTANYDPQYKFKHVLEHLNITWAREFQLSRDISIDETIVGFKGRHKLVNYIKIKKHHQWGPKEYNLADAKSGYIHLHWQMS